MARFEYLEARTLRHAISLMQRHGEEARIVAGSTDFLVRWRAEVWQPKYPKQCLKAKYRKFFLLCRFPIEIYQNLHSQVHFHNYQFAFYTH